MSALLGGALIGLAAAILLLANGNIAGISGIVGGLVRPRPGDTLWRATFLAGLLLSGVLLSVLRPGTFEVTSSRSTLVLVAAGLLVGYGTRLGNGCTSGHGVCGVSRLSARSVVATLTFMGAGMLTVYASRHLQGGAP